jgi:hypothetical protein
MSDYSQSGFNDNLERSSTIQDTEVRQLTPQEADFVIPELDGSKIINYNSNDFTFNPSQAPSNPKEGDTYYDKTAKKLKIWTGNSWELVNSS